MNSRVRRARAPDCGALIGFGRVAEHAHLPAYRGRVKIAVVVDPDGARRRQARALLGESVRIYSELGEMLEVERPLFVDVATPPADHAYIIEATASRGIHVLVEKPLAVTLSDSLRARRAALQAGVVLMTVHNWHHAPSFRAAIGAIAAGAIGPPRELEFFTERTQPAGGASSWRLDAGVAGGGILLDHGWHQLYLARALAGGSDPCSVRAVAGRQRWTAGSVEDTVDCMVRFHGNGATGKTVARLRLSWAAERRRTRVVVHGERGVLRINGATVSIKARDGRERELPIDGERSDDSYHAAWFPPVLDAFLAAIDKPELAVENQHEAALCQAVINAAYHSAGAGGTEVAVEVYDACAPATRYRWHGWSGRWKTKLIANRGRERAGKGSSHEDTVS